MQYIPNTEQDREEMLRAIGIPGIEDLFADIPTSVRLNRPLDLPGPMPEMELAQHMRDLAGMNGDLDGYVSFLGAGAYDHYIPKIIDQMLLRSEFYTAYTPYQPEISQGTLQAIFEYQSLICELTGMDVANASMYDGASALAEAVLMAGDFTRKNKVLISRAVHPEYRETVLTYARGKGMEVAEIPLDDGVTSLKDLESMLDDRVAAVVIQQPNFFGCLEPAAEAAELTHGAKSLFVVCADPVSLGILKPPGAYGADIVVGEGQSLGNPVSFGGPFLGFLACREKVMRRMPGRLVGQTVDTSGRRGFVLTLQAREQHIRREKATSNICSNEALCALAATIYLTTVGKKGLRQVAELSLRKAHYALKKLSEIKGVTPAFERPFFKEFVVKVANPPEQINRRLLEQKIIGGLDIARFYPEMAGQMLFCVTEKRTKEEIDRLAAGMEV
ncbi:glycine dehydrogenase [Clostridiales bacterium PH28_bin88]|nr:glycine dehydrogenase [Clostridiales bacterium PH28_bin88]